jgi:SAM-dependent methyltransferase
VALREDPPAGLRAEVEYPDRVGEGGRRWLRTKPFGNAPRETARLLIDFGYLVQLLDVHAGTRVCELGCGSGWLTCFLARAGAEAEGYDISPGMIEIARERAQAERVDARFGVADFEALNLDRRFDACVVYDALHHTSRPELVLISAQRALRPGGVLVLAEPNLKHRFKGRTTTREFGTTELGYSPRRIKRLLRSAGFERVERFQNNRKRLYGSAPGDVALHLLEPILSRLLAPFWTQVWIRARAR